MNIHDLRQAQKTFDIKKFKADRMAQYRLRQKFVNDYNVSSLKKLKLDDFVVGKGNQSSFCYRLERELDNLGSIRGSAAPKFGVYYNKDSGRYKNTKKWGENYKEAYKNIRSAIIDLIEAGQRADMGAIINNEISPMFKGKILATYYPDRYLNIFSGEHLNHYLTFFGLDFDDFDDPIEQRVALISFKNQDPIMKKWDLDSFAYFLYAVYPKAPGKEYDNDPILTDYEPFVFPFSPTVEEVNLTIISKEEGEADSPKSKHGKIDYERDNKKMKLLGDRGEDIVKDFEIDRLKKAGKNKLAKKVERVSLKSDSYGYDILSFNEDGTERHIEVKATQSKVGTVNFFLTANELNTAKEEGEKYYIYIVYEISTKNPKVWILKNPFNSESPGIKIVPVNFRVKINAK